MKCCILNIFFWSKLKGVALSEECFKIPEGHTARNISPVTKERVINRQQGYSEQPTQLYWGLVIEWLHAWNSFCVPVPVSILIAVEKLKRYKWPCIPQMSADFIHSRGKISARPSSHLMGHHLPRAMLHLRVIMFSMPQLSWRHAVTASSRGQRRSGERN